MLALSTNNRLIQSHLPKSVPSPKSALAEKMRLILDDVRQGRLVLIVDDEIEGEGDVCVAAEMATLETINFMATECRGIICQSITLEMAERLDLPLMVPNGGSPAFTISVDVVGVGSGTSAYDRAKTARALVDPKTCCTDLLRPGHMFPLITRSGGVLERPGHTEASADLARLAGFTPSSVICEVMDEEGYMAGPDKLRHFAKAYKMNMITVRDIIEFRCQMDDSQYLNGIDTYTN